MIKVENMTSERSGRSVANQFIITTDNEITFQSYESIVAIYNRQTKVVKIYNDIANCSRTTAKYFRQFLAVYIPFLFSEGEELKQIVKAVKNSSPHDFTFVTVERDSIKIVKVWNNIGTV